MSDRLDGIMVASYRRDEDAERAARFLGSWGIDAYVAHGLEIAGARAYEEAIAAAAAGGALAGSLVGLALSPVGLDPEIGTAIPMYTGVLGGVAVGALAGLFGYPPHACRRSFANAHDRFGVFVDETHAERALLLLRA
jgi:hypothetical protein